MILVHTTPIANLQSILEDGVLLACAANKKDPRVWVHDEDNNGWAEQHVCLRHRCEEVAHIYIEVQDDQVTLFRGGLYYVRFSIMPQHFRSATRVERREYAVQI
jgi:hypothetical protein